MRINVALLRRRIDLLGTNVRKLEKVAGLRTGAIHNILFKKSQNPTVETLLKISAALECSMHDLVIEDGDETPNTQVPELVWDINIYLKCIAYITNRAKNRRISLTKEKLLSLTDELHLYAIKANAIDVDQTFADWILDRVSPTS